MGQKVAGTVYFKVDGRQLTVTGAAEAPVGNVTRETIAPGHYSEVDRVPSLKVDAVHTADFPLKEITEGTDMTIQCDFNNGKSYVLSGAYLIGETVSTGDDGKVALEFHGIEGRWV